MYLSIIADYGLKTSLCELIDNAIDHWISAGKTNLLLIELFLETDRAQITVRDNAGGVPYDQMKLLISPGATRLNQQDELIGNFGVGGKRASIALGERVVITSGVLGESPAEIIIDQKWISSDDWSIQATKLQGSGQGKTEVKITELRQGFSHSDLSKLREAFAEIYDNFVREGIVIRLNGEPISGARFDNWAYPPEYPPRTSKFEIQPDGKRSISVTLTAGLILDRDPEAHRYGVYFYCNGRLIIPHLKSREVGFLSGEAGIPHRDASSFRVVVELNGSPELMPWTSHKGAINFSHVTFEMLQTKIVELTTYYSKLSRRLKNDRDTEIHQYQTGTVEPIDIELPKTERKVVLPPLPSTRRKPYPDRILEKNAKIIRNAPWTLGLIDTIGEIDTISRKRIETKNRIILILLDSNLEIALKEFIVHNPDKFPAKKYGDTEIRKLFNARHSVINEIKPHLNLSKEEWVRVSHYYGIRNKLIHERATVQITDREIEDLRELVEKIMTELFGVDLGDS